MISFPGDRFYQIINFLIQKRIHIQVFLDFIFAHISSNELALGWHIHAIKTGPFYGRTGNGKIHLFGAKIPKHTHNLPTGISPDNTVIHNQHFFITNFCFLWHKFIFYGFLSLCLSRHNKGSADKGIFIQTFRIAHTQFMGKRQGRGVGCAWGRNHNIGGYIGIFLFPRVCQVLTHPKSGSIDAYIIQSGIGAGEIHVFKNAGIK